jgi:hypothetical protein
MHETPDDLERLQALLGASIERAGAFLRSSFEMPDRSLSAGQVVRLLHGVQTVAFATVTSKGEPRVAPIGAIFYRGAFYIPTVMSAMRVRHIRRQPGVSLTFYQGIDLAVIVHGTASVLGVEHPDFTTLEDIQRGNGGQTVRDWGEGAFVRVDADVFYTYARYPDRFPE